MPDFRQLSDDPRVASTFVLCRHPYHELADLSGDGRTQPANIMMSI